MALVLARAAKCVMIFRSYLSVAGKEIGLNVVARHRKVKQHAIHIGDHAVWTRNVENRVLKIDHDLF